MFRDRFFVKSLVLFIIINILLYSFTFLNHSKVPFHNANYQLNSYQYLQDPRANGGEFSFLRGLNVWDAQWYIRIAEVGYSPKESFASSTDRAGEWSYAFFPLYPILIFSLDFLTQNVELAAFLLATVLLLANFFSMYFVITQLFSKTIAVKTIFLLFLFPFGIFYRSFYTESLFLLLFVWFSYFLLTRQWFRTALMASLLFVTRPNGFVLGFVMGATFLYELYKRKMSWTKAIIYGLLSLIPFAGWMYFNTLQTGNLLHWQAVQSNWFASNSVLETLGYNIQLVGRFFELPFHEAHQSQVDVVIVFLSLFLLIISRKFFWKHYPQLWWASLLIWLLPLVVKDMQSFSRFQSVVFPLFLFLAVQLKGISYYALCFLFFVLLLLTSLFFVNWHWVG